MTNKKTAVLLVSLALLVGSAAAQATSNTSEATNVTVEVSETSAIDIKPDSLDYNSVDVGTQQVESNNSPVQYSGVQIENIGSVGVDEIWAQATKPSSRPFGTGSASNYDAGNFIQIQADTVSSSVSNYHFVNRKEYNESTDLTYIETTPADFGGSRDTQYYGRFRSGDEWYFWSIPVDTSSGTNYCDGGENNLYVGQEPHSSTQTGSVDFSADSSSYDNYSIEDVAGSSLGAAYSVNMTFNGNDRSYDVLTNCEDDEVFTIRTRFNVQAGNATAGEAADDLSTDASADTQYILDVSDESSEDELQPGGSFSVPTAIEVPQGVAAGEVDQGQLTFYVSTRS